MKFIYFYKALFFSFFTILLITSCRKTSVKFEGINLTGAVYGQDFNILKDTKSNSRTIREFNGKVVVIFFGYVQCPDFCPTTLLKMSEVKEILGNQGQFLQTIFISVDPERDTSEILEAYTQAFDKDSIALSGNEQELKQITQDFRVFYKKVEGKSENSYTIDHSAGLYIYDTFGKLKIYHAYESTTENIAKDVKTLLSLAEK